MHALSLRENWVGLESNPEVLTKYAHKLGVQESWGFSDVFGLDDEALKMVPSPCVGIIFLYPYSQVETRKKALGTCRGKKKPGVWYMSQTIGNACGAVALMHTVMNCLDRVSQDSSFLSKFQSDTENASSGERGNLFGGALRDVHDELASGGQTNAPKPNADLDFHFISLVPVKGVLYELDGNNDGPIDLGPVGEGSDAFLRAAVAHVKKSYIAPFPDSNFSMMALGPRETAGKNEG